jgi:hypothetical protein
MLIPIPSPLGVYQCRPRVLDFNNCGGGYGWGLCRPLWDTLGMIQNEKGLSRPLRNSDWENDVNCHSEMHMSFAFSDIAECHR